MSTTPSFEPDIEFYLDSNTHASTRVRSVLTLLVTATILTIMGLFNSCKSSWMTQRLKANFSYDEWRYYIAQKYIDDTIFLENIGYKRKGDVLSKIPLSASIDSSLHDAWKNFRNSYYRSYIDNELNIRIPFFGVAFDINDLGLFAGIGLSAIFILLYMSLGNEISCIGLAFRSLRFHIDTYFFDFLNSSETRSEVQKIVMQLNADQELKYVQNFKNKLRRITSRENSVYEKILEYFKRNGKHTQIENIRGVISLAKYINNKKDFDIADPKDFIRILAFLRRKKWTSFEDDLNMYDKLRKTGFDDFKVIVPKEGNQKMDNFHNFYHLLATRQVFVLPFIEGSKHPYKRILGLTQKIPLVICFFPVLVFCLIVVNDMITFNIGASIDEEGMLKVSALNIIFLCIVTILATSCWKMWKKIKHLWESTWEELKFYKSYTFLVNIEDYLKYNPYPKFMK